MIDPGVGKYQTLDRLSDEDYDALEADILERGVLVAVELDEDGNVLDGHHRQAIAVKHKLPYPTIVRSGWTEEQKRTHSRRMNLARRQLTSAQRRNLIEDELRESPQSSNRKIAASLGVSDKTVGAARTRLERGAEIPQVGTVTGSNGMPFTRRFASPATAVKQVDSQGAEVPHQLIATFATRNEFTLLHNLLSDAKRRMLALRSKSKGMDRSENVVRHSIDRLQAILAGNIPDRICGDCGGAGCKACARAGYLSGAVIQEAIVEQNPNDEGDDV